MTLHRQRKPEARSRGAAGREAAAAQTWAGGSVWLGDDAVDGAATLGAGLVGSDLAGASGLDREPELLLERPADGAADGVVLPAGGRGDLLDRGALGALEHLDHARLLGAGAGRSRRGRRGLGDPRVVLGRLALFRRLGRAGRTRCEGGGLDSGTGRRRARVARRRALWRVVLGLDADGLEAGAGDPERRRVVAARGALVVDQALGFEAAEDLVDGAALDLEALRPRQDRAIVALGSGAEDDRLGVAELRHRMISVLGEHRRSPTSPSPGGWCRAGRGREIEGISLPGCSPSAGGPRPRRSNRCCARPRGTDRRPHRPRSGSRTAGARGCRWGRWRRR